MNHFPPPTLNLKQNESLSFVYRNFAYEFLFRSIEQINMRFRPHPKTVVGRMNNEQITCNVDRRSRDLLFRVIDFNEFFVSRVRVRKSYPLATSSDDSFATRVR